MTLTACDEPHPLLDGEVVDQLRVVHDVFGHAALGLGFDLQSEFATWLQCRTLFSAAARPAAFCELVGAVTAYIVTGEKPGLQAKLPPAELLAPAHARGRRSTGQPICEGLPHDRSSRRGLNGRDRRCRLPISRARPARRAGPWVRAAPRPRGWSAPRVSRVAASQQKQRVAAIATA